MLRLMVAKISITVNVVWLKGGETVLGKNNLKHLEWHINNDGKKIKIILIFLS